MSIFTTGGKLLLPDSEMEMAGVRSSFPVGNIVWRIT